MLYLIIRGVLMLTMNYVTANTTISHNIPYVGSIVTSRTDPSVYRDATMCYLRDIHTNSPEERSKAAKAICEMGYITEWEAERLVDGIVRRNDYTVIHLEEFSEIIIVSCYEDDPSATQSKVKLFQLVYTKSSGKVDVVGQEYILD